MNDTPALDFALELQVSIAAPLDLGVGSTGRRRTIPITGGSFEGPRIKGEVVPGGADFQVTRADGCRLVEALYTIKAEDGALIHVRNRGLVDPSDPKAVYVRTVPEFDAPQGPHEWLNRAVFVGTLRVAPQGGAVIVRVYRVG